MSDSASQHSRENDEGQNKENNQATRRIMEQSCTQRSSRLLHGHRRHGSKGFGICRAGRSPASFGKMAQSKRFSRALIWLLPLVVLALAGCGFDGAYRYECQDPKIFTDRKAYPECHKPLCESSGICSEDLLGTEIYERIMAEVDEREG